MWRDSITFLRSALLSASFKYPPAPSARMKCVAAQSLSSPACFSSTHCKGLTASICFQHQCKCTSKKLFLFLCVYSRRAISNGCQVAAALLTARSIFKLHLSCPGSFQEESIATSSSKKEHWADNPAYPSNMFAAGDCNGAVPGNTDGSIQNKKLCWFSGIRKINRRYSEDL